MCCTRGVSALCNLRYAASKSIFYARTLSTRVLSGIPLQEQESACTPLPPGCTASIVPINKYNRAERCNLHRVSCNRGLVLRNPSIRKLKMLFARELKKSQTCRHGKAHYGPRNLENSHIWSEETAGVYRWHCRSATAMSPSAIRSVMGDSYRRTQVRSDQC